MGNHIPPGIPPMLAKNWQPVPDHPNSFRNKLTGEYTHKHIINIEHSIEIQSFKSRMKETNPYICRVLFYHQYHESIYHVYTDEIHLQPGISKPDAWRLEKVRIMEAFMQLARVYGWMKVCRQMIGSDSNEGIKVWIHPDPVSARPWSPCNSELIMINDILTILQGIQERSGQRDKKVLEKCMVGNSQIEYTSFQQYIEHQMLIVHAEESQVRSSRPNRSSSILQNFQASFNRQVHHETNGPHRKNMNKTYAFPSQIHQPKTDHIKQDPRLSNEESASHFGKNSKLQKLFNPVQCATSRQDDHHKDYFQTKSRENMPANAFIQSGYHNNMSLERPTTYYQDSHSRAYHDENYKIVGNPNSPPKRRQTQNFKLIQQNYRQQTTLNKRQDSSKSSVYLKPKQSDLKPDTTNKGKNQFSKLLTKIRIPTSPSNTNTQQNRLSKTSQTLINPKHQNNKSKITPYQHYQYRKQYKMTPIPNFLIKSSELDKDIIQSKAAVYPKYPSTQRQKDVKFKQEVYLNHQMQKTGLNIISAKSIGESSEGGHADHSENRSRNNTVAMLKEQLNFILESPIQPPKRPVSQDYQNFKSKKLMYRASEMGMESEEGKDELDIIKEKVEEKKAKFAQLKTDARKILEDDL